MKLAFTKMQGLGNDFIVIDGIRQPFTLTTEQIRFIADRHIGVGCDQLLLVESSQTAKADFRYRIFNADGSEVSQCGNGARCFALYVREKALTKLDNITVETGAGLLYLHCEKNGDITVNMGIPHHTPANIPINSTEEKQLYTLDIKDTTWSFGAVSIGNPHAVIQVEEINLAPVESIGSTLEKHSIFPERANIGFMQVISSNCIKLRVYERGAAETKACGSGACAAAIVGIDNGSLKSPVQVELPGGQLMISWQGRGQPVYMRGIATLVFEGVLEL